MVFIKACNTIILKSKWKPHMPTYTSLLGSVEKNMAKVKSIARHLLSLEQTATDVANVPKHKSYPFLQRAMWWWHYEQ